MTVGSLLRPIGTADTAVGAFIIDSEHGGAFLDALDGPGGTGLSPGPVFLCEGWCICVRVKRTGPVA